MYKQQKRKVMLLRGLIKLHRNSMKALERSKDRYKELVNEKVQKVNTLQEELFSLKDKVKTKNPEIQYTKSLEQQEAQKTEATYIQSRYTELKKQVEQMEIQLMYHTQKFSTYDSQTKGTQTCKKLQEEVCMVEKEEFDAVNQQVRYLEARL